MDGTIWAWGYGDFPNFRPRPEQVGRDFTAVAAGNDHTVGITSSQEVREWTQDYSQIPNGELRVGSARSVSGGYDYTLAIQNDGTLLRWTGSSDITQLGTGFASVSAGYEHAAGIKADGTLWTWGKNTSGQLGDGTTIDRTVPMQIGSGFIAVAAGDTHTLAIKSDNTLWAWGRNHNGLVGNGYTTAVPAPVP